MHWLEEDWSLQEGSDTKHVLPIYPTMFDYVRIFNLKPVLINFKEISHKPLLDKQTNRYEQANVKYPMMVTAMHNPDNLPYRMIDGRHRIHKLKDSGVQQGYFYIIPLSFVLLNIRIVKK